MRALEGALRARWVSGVISTDDILPARYKHMYADPAKLGPHVFENHRPGFAATLAPGDVLLSRELFGTGSSREQAVSALLSAGVRAAVAPAFGRIFFRNAWNLGLAALEIPEVVCGEGGLLTVDLDRSVLETEGRIFSFPAIPGPIRAMLEDGGLLAHVRKHWREPRR